MNYKFNKMKKIRSKDICNDRCHVCTCGKSCNINIYKDLSYPVKFNVIRHYIYISNKNMKEKCHKSRKINLIL